METCNLIFNKGVEGFQEGVGFLGVTVGLGRFRKSRRYLLFISLSQHSGNALIHDTFPKLVKRRIGQKVHYKT